jgi:DNA-binding GntR family transcriptional regulator
MAFLIPLLNNPDLVSRVYDAVLEAICTGEIAGTDRITQEAIAAMLGVSRQPVLQALRMLEKDGLLRSTPNKKGMELVPLDAQFVSHLYSVRSTLDALAAKSTASIPRPDLRDEGYQLLKQGRIASQEGQLNQLVLADLAFHQFIYKASGNPFLEQSSTLHWHHTRRVMSTYLRMPASFRNVWNEHQAILDAIIKGESREAEKLSRQHALNSIDFLFAHSADVQGPPAVKPATKSRKTS